jgi:hypothetical protein
MHRLSKVLFLELLLLLHQSWMSIHIPFFLFIGFDLNVDALEGADELDDKDDLPVEDADELDDEDELPVEDANELGEDGLPVEDAHLLEEDDLPNEDGNGNVSSVPVCLSCHYQCSVILTVHSAIASI